MLKRIVSLAPSTTAILTAIGAKENLVGVSRYCKDLSDVADLPRLGDFWNISNEDVLKLKPDLIIGALPYRSEAVQKLIKTGIPFFLTHPRSFNEIFLDIEWLGVLTKHEEEAAQLIYLMKSEIDHIQEQARHVTNRVRVYCEEWMKPITCSISWVKEMVEIAGGIFVPDKSGSVVESEEVIAANPEIIILSWCGAGGKSNPKYVTSRPGWDRIQAVQTGRIYVVPDQYFNSPCQHLITGLSLMAKIVHPEVFGAFVPGAFPKPFTLELVQ